MLDNNQKELERKLRNRWHSMKHRCQNPNSKSYENYGGRGITICSEWEVFENFYNWSINSGYDPKLQIDRINNDAGYSPDNCRWVSAKVNANNKRSMKPQKRSILIKELSEISQETGISLRTLRSRYNRGQRGSELSAPLRKPWDRARELRNID